MVRFVVSDEIRDVIEEYNTRKKLCEEDPGYIDPKDKSIEHVQLADLLHVLQSTTTDPAKTSQYSLHQVLRSTSLYIEPPVPRTPVLFPSPLSPLPFLLSMD
jgi:hypothetical protein